jgi:antitoxin HigA-1
MRPPNPIHPGRILLEEFLLPAQIPPRAMAKRLGWRTAKLNELIHAKHGITADSAMELALQLGTSPEVWLNLQMQFDLHCTER